MKKLINKIKNSISKLFSSKKRTIITISTIIALLLLTIGISVYVLNNKKSENKPENKQIENKTGVNNDNRVPENNGANNTNVAPGAVITNTTANTDNQPVNTANSNVNTEKKKEKYWVVDRPAEPAIPAKAAVTKVVDFTNDNKLKQSKRDNVSLESKAKYNLDLVGENGNGIQRYTYDEGANKKIFIDNLNALKSNHENSVIKDYKVSNAVYRHSWTEVVVEAQAGKPAVPELGHYEYR